MVRDPGLEPGYGCGEQRAVCNQVCNEVCNRITHFATIAPPPALAFRLPSEPDYPPPT